MVKCRINFCLLLPFLLYFSIDKGTTYQIAICRNKGKSKKHDFLQKNNKKFYIILKFWSSDSDNELTILLFSFAYFERRRKSIPREGFFLYGLTSLMKSCAILSFLEHYSTSKFFIRPFIFIYLLYLSCILISNNVIPYICKKF